MAPADNTATTVIENAATTKATSAPAGNQNILLHFKKLKKINLFINVKLMILI